MSIKITEELWVVLTPRGNIYAAGVDVPSAVKNAIRRKRDSCIDGPITMFDALWYGLEQDGYRCVRVNINQTLTMDELEEHDTYVENVMSGNLTHFDP